MCKKPLQVKLYARTNWERVHVPVYIALYNGVNYPSNIDRIVPYGQLSANFTNLIRVNVITPPLAITETNG